jgi:phosphopantothenoylcysteine decarboxylase / phosphopantothenate---cysteine ligase
VILKGKKCLVTAGPTYEAIDPVRFIGNRSSGKMGIEIARELAERGAKVHLILGPSSQPIPENIKYTRVESAEQMYQAVMRKKEWLDIGIFSAAVADYTPKFVADEKIKKTDEEFSIELVKTKDILKEVGLNKKENQFIVGFALETNKEIEHAKAKLERKNLDMIILNSLKNEGAGFQHDTNQISILDRQNNITHFELKTKKEVARDIVDYIEKWN